MTSDAPHELFERGIFTGESAAAAGRLLVRSEYLVEDLNTFAGLVRRRTPVGILSEAARGRPEGSVRYRDLLAPSGIPFELRAAFVSRGRAWGAVHIARREERGDFSRADANAIAQVAGAITDGIRTSLRFDAARRAQETAPGLVVLDERAEHRPRQTRGFGQGDPTAALAPMADNIEWHEAGTLRRVVQCPGAPGVGGAESSGRAGILGLLKS